MEVKKNGQYILKLEHWSMELLLSKLLSSEVSNCLFHCNAVSYVTIEIQSELNALSGHGMEI